MFIDIMHGETYVVRRSGKGMTIFAVVGLIALISIVVDFEEVSASPFSGQFKIRGLI